jgi:hypothetical protein
MRGLRLALGVTIVAVLALDLTAIATNPGPAARATTVTSSSRPALRLLNWSGEQWLVNPPSAQGPEQTPLSDTGVAAHVDAAGRLHLTVTKVDGRWRSVQLEALGPVNYGTYHFVTDSSIATLAKPLDFAMFVFQSGAARLTNEIDLEDSRALLGMRNGLDAQYVVQPYTEPHHIHRYVVDRDVAVTQQQFIWTQRDVSFLTRLGAGADAPIISQFHYRGPSNPAPDGEHLYVDLFLHGGVTTVGPGTRTAVLDSFTYTPA